MKKEGALKKQSDYNNGVKRRKTLIIDAYIEQQVTKTVGFTVENKSKDED